MNNGLIARLVINDKVIENDNTLEPNIQSLIIEEVTTQRNNLALGICAINRLTSVIKNPKDLSLSGAKIKVFVKKLEEGTEIAEVEPLADDTVLFVDETYIDDDDTADIANTVAQINQNELKTKEIEVRQYFGYADDYPLSEAEILAKYDEMTASDSTESEGNPQDSVAEDATEYSEADDTSTEAPDIEVAIHDNSDSFGENSFTKINEEDVDSESTLIDEETVSDGWIPAGEFTIASAVPNGESIKITAYDNMYKLTGKYIPESRELTNVSDYFEELRSQILSKYGVTVLDTALPEIYLTWNIECTYREALGYIAGLVGGIATSNRRGEIEIKTYGYTSTQIQNYDSFVETSDQMALIEAISVDTVGLGNPADYVVEGESDNPLWFADPLYGEIATYADPDVEGGDDTEITAQTVLSDVYTSLSSLNYQPCTVICDWDTGLEVTRLVKLLTPEDVEEKMKLLNQLANETDEGAQELLKNEIDALGRNICINNQMIDLVTGKVQIQSIGENSEQITTKNFDTENDKKITRLTKLIVDFIQAVEGKFGTDLNHVVLDEDGIAIIKDAIEMLRLTTEEISFLDNQFYIGNGAIASAGGLGLEAHGGPLRISISIGSGITLGLDGIDIKSVQRDGTPARISITGYLDKNLNVRRPKNSFGIMQRIEDTEEGIGFLINADGEKYIVARNSAGQNTNYLKLENGSTLLGQALAVGSGGTGESTRYTSIEFSSFQGTGSYGCRYYPYLNMCFVRLSLTGKAISAGTLTNIATVPARYRPEYNNALAAFHSGSSSSVKARINSDGQIGLICSADLTTSSAVNITGWWIVS